MLYLLLFIWFSLAVGISFPSTIYGKPYNKKLKMHCHKCGGEFQAYEFEKNEMNESWRQEKYGLFRKMGGKPYVICKIDPWENYSKLHLKYCEVKPYTKKKQITEIN